MKKLLAKIRKILRDRRTRRFLTRFVSGVAALIVFVTTYALVLPAITMEKEANCGIEAHQHDDFCYTEELICDIPESDGHHHDESCYSTTSALVCETEEHEHSAENGCYDDEGNLICEVMEHRHNEECYEEVRELTCQIPESEGHHHTEDCYEKVLTCGKEVHVHSTACYEDDPVSDTAVAASTSSAAAATTSAGSVSSAGMTLNFEGDIEKIIDTDEPVDDDSVDNIGSDETDRSSETNGTSEIASSSETDTEAASDSEVTYGRENAGTGRTETSNTALTNADNSATALISSADTDQYIPQLNAVDFNTVLNNHTGIYYHHAADEETVEDSSAIPAEDWNRIPNNIDRMNDDLEDVELGKNDLLRVYLSYTIPAGSLNATNPVARYRLPSNLHLTDPQVKAMNENVNGLAGQYVDMSTLEITDPDKYNAYLGVEAVEGTRKPDEAVEDYLAEQAVKTGADAADTAEYINAVVRVENVYDVDGLYGEKDAYLGQDLIFTFAPYSIEKNQHEYDSTGKPTKAGEEIEGWFTFDLNMGQVDFEEPEITTTTVEASDEDIVDGDSEDEQVEDDNAEYDYVEESHTEDSRNVSDHTKDDHTENEQSAADETNRDRAENAEDKPGEVDNTIDNNTDAGEDSGEGDSTEENDGNLNKDVSIGHAEREAEIIFVEEGWDEKGNQIDPISTTLTVVEETTAETQDNDAEENSAEIGAEDTEKTTDEDETPAEMDAADSSSNGKTETTAEEDNADTTNPLAESGSVANSAESNQAIMPAMSFTDSIRVSTGKPAGINENAEGILANAAESLPEEAEVSVRVEADEGTFPAGTIMVLKAVDNLDAVAEAVTETIESGDSSISADGEEGQSDQKNDIRSNNSTEEKKNLKTYGFQAVDITFLDKDGNEIEPAKPVRVALSSAVVEQAREKVEDSAIADPVVVHVDNEGKAEQMDLISPEEVEPAKGRSEEELLEEAEKAAESDKTDSVNKEVPSEEVPADNDKEKDRADNATENTDEGAGDTNNNSGDNSNAASDGEEYINETNNNASNDEAEQSGTAEAAVTTDTAVEEDGNQGSTAEFNADSFSVYAIVYSVELYTNIITDSGETYRITVTYDESSGIPQDAELRVREITESDAGYEHYYAEAVKAAAGSSETQNDTDSALSEPNSDANDDNNINKAETTALQGVENNNTYARFFDIEIWADGKKVEPTGNVSVSIRLLDIPEDEDKNVIKIVHFDKGGPEIIPHTENRDNEEIRNNSEITDDVNRGNTEESGDTEPRTVTEFNFTTSSFSVYSVVSYTVDFHWEVDGKAYEFRLPGGGFASFAKLMEVMGIAKKSANDDSEEKTTDIQAPEETKTKTVRYLNDVQVSDETKKFVADVEKVEFSKPVLLSVSKAEKDTTVGAIKEGLGLECEYSSELTEEDIEQINATEVEGGDWALISLKAFDTVESLTVTMKDGNIFTINVTDARIGNELNGQEFVIVSKNNLAMTADDASLTAGSLSANSVTGNGNQIWAFEHISRPYGDVYRLKSVAQNKYIVLNNDGGLSFTDNQSGATEFWIDKDSDNTYQFTTNLPPTFQTTVCLNTVDSSGVTRYRTGFDWNQRFTLQEAKTTNKNGDWLLFLDEEQDDIYIHVGDTITLRPYDKWTWKVGSATDAQYRWKFDNISGAPSDWNTSQYGTTNEAEGSKETWYCRDNNNNVIIEFNRHVKYDDQLITRYWSIQGTARNPGEYVLENTENDHKIKVHVLPASDTSHQLGSFSGTDRIKVNLFDYDTSFKLDPLNNSNANGSYQDAINTYYNNGWQYHDLRFSSSGGGSGINRYTRDTANPGIVNSKLGDDNFPELAGGSKESLAYLFDTSKTTWSGGKENDAIIAYPELTGLFQQDRNGYYYYNSNSNYAYYDPGDDPNNPNKSITLYEHTYTQTRTLERTVNGRLEHYSGLFNSKPIGFFPFHDYDSQNDLWVNQNHNLNHHMGMSMEVKFALPSGKVTKDGKPITFEFTGDDDIWVFVDDDLSLDMGGIHQPIYGKIDFTNDDRFEAGREYTLRVFYLERGGCDSNCAIKFNMPLTIGTADVNVVKHDKEENTPLPGAEFAIWENEECTGEPLRRATSDNSGNVHFESLPIFEVGQVYYMKETKAPAGYFLDSTVYMLTAERIGQTDNFRFNISVHKPGADPLNTTGGNNPIPIVDNTKVSPIDLTIRKEWQDTDGTSHVPEGAGATFKIKRWRTYCLTNEEQPYRVNLRDASNNILSNGTRWAYKGEKLTIRYNHYYDSNPRDYVPKTASGYDALPMTTAEGWHNAEYTVDPKHANTGTHTIDIRMTYDDFLRWCYNQPYFTTGYEADPGTRITQGDSVHELDDAYNNSQTEGVFTLPYQGDWTRTIKNLQTTGQQVIEGKTYTCYYDYFIEELSSTPAGYEAIYLDNHNNVIPSSKVQDLATHEDGNQKIINRKLINIPVEKRWPDYEHAGYTWEAVLHMDFRDVPLDGSAPSSWAPYHEGESDEENYVITLGNTTGHSLSGAFQNLPMYVTRSDGTVCRREYSVVEQSYTVWENGRIVASFDGTTYYPDDNHKYALWYQHDAGEDDNYSDTDYPGEEDYNIMVYNMHENRTTLKDIGLTINKVWKDADGQVISEIPGDYKTRFVLKRKVIVEYRNYENESTPRNEWVWVKLIAGSHEQMLQVPPGRQMFIRGNILKDKDPGLIVFRDSNNAEYQASMDDDSQFKDYNLFKIPFNAPDSSQSSDYTNKESPFIVEHITGSDFVVGGDDGFILSDSNDRQVIGVDSTFSKEFELSNEKGWTKVFPKTGSASGSDDPQEQFENEHPLPAIEVSTLDASGNTANTYIYTYYFEEVECIPDSFYATFTDSSNNLIGGASQPFYSDEIITATNRPIGLEVLKVDQDKTTLTLPGAVFKLRKLDDGPNGSYPVSTNNGTFSGTEYDTQTTAQGTGKASFSRRPLPSGTGFLQGLLPGYYEVKETKAPDGYVLTENVVFYVHVEKTGLVKLLKKQEVQDQEGVFTLSEAGANELVGKATLSAAQTANGQTIVITVRNEPGVELPSSGGSGTKMIYLLGGVLTVASVLLLIRKRIRE